MSDIISSFVELYSREDVCEPDNHYDGRMGARISAIFVILVTSAFGSFFPMLSSKYSFIRMPSWCFFTAKYFGSGVILATAFVHLLGPAAESLSSECLGAPFTTYPWAFGIALMSLCLLFFVELIAYRYVEWNTAKYSGEGEENGVHSHSHFGDQSVYLKKAKEVEAEEEVETSSEKLQTLEKFKDQQQQEQRYPSHFSHAAEHQDPEVIGTPANDLEKEQYFGQVINVLVLEFGVLFHSVFIGLSLAVAGEEFVSLYIVLVFHQMFEGLGIGTRVATTAWPKSKRWIAWSLCVMYSLTTPIAIAIGLGVRKTYPPGSRRSLIVSGVFDALSAGVLLYAGLVELMAHEFLFSNEFKGPGGFKKMIIAFIILCFGAGIMALLGRWA